MLNLGPTTAETTSRELPYPVNLDVKVVKTNQYYAIERAIQHKLPYLIRGPHGSAKTIMAKHILAERYINEYGPESVFSCSAATIDPWLNFMGIPEKRTEEHNGKQVSFLEMVLPKRFAFGQVRAILVDEYNRGGKPIKNALMELIQTRSMNGVRFENLESVGAIINPFSEFYDTEELDLAQQDRFVVQVDFGPEPCIAYFTEKYSRFIANGISEWWRSLSEEHQRIISSRRIDYALENYALYDIPLTDLLPRAANIPYLKTCIQNGPIQEKLKHTKDEDLERFFADENNYSAARDYVMTANSTNLGRYFPYFPPEKIGNELSRMNEAALKDLLTQFTNYHARKDSIKTLWPKLKSVADQTVKANGDPEFCDMLKVMMDKFTGSGAIRV